MRCMHAGTVVDRGMTHPSEMDFFLLSQAGLKGTSRPTHYHVILNQNQLSPDEIQQFAHQCADFATVQLAALVVPEACRVYSFHCEPCRVTMLELAERTDGLCCDVFTSAWLGCGESAFSGLWCRMCFLYCRCTRAVSMCPPAYYAHLAAARARALLPPEDTFSDTQSLSSSTSATMVGSVSKNCAGTVSCDSMPGGYASLLFIN